MEKEVKQYFEAVNEKLDQVIDTMATRGELQSLVSRVDVMEKKFDDRFNEIMTALDRFAKSLNDLLVEYAAIKMQTVRYDRWFKQLADHVGIKLES